MFWVFLLMIPVRGLSARRGIITVPIRFLALE
jgi:hypothetical protein